MQVRFDDGDLKKAGRRIIFLIKRNIQAGKDIHGNPLAPYTPEYEARKASKKQNFSIGDAVDLVYDGIMLASLNTVKVEGNKLIIGFNDQNSAELAYYHNISGAGKGRVLREFLGLTDEDKEDERLKELLAGAVRISDIFE